PRPDRAALHPEPGRVRPAGLDGHRRGDLPVPAAGGDLHLRAPQPPLARHVLRSDPQMISSARLQRVAEIVMIAGIVALCQPWNLFLHRYGLTIIIVGLVTFMCTNWFGTSGADREEEMDGVFDVSDHHE